MVVVLEDVAFRVDGLRYSEQALERRHDVVLDLSACSVAEGLWALPAIDAIAARTRGARLGVLAGEELSHLLVAHLRSRRPEAARCVASAASTPGALRVEISPRPSTRPLLSRDRDHLRVPSRPFPKRVQHAWGHWVDGARACGLDARATRPKLSLDDTYAARRARRWLRERFGRRGRTLVALLPSGPGPNARRWGVDAFACVGRELASRLGAVLLCRGTRVPGATSLDDLDIVTSAHILSMVAVAIGDADGLVHLAAAAGAPSVSVHGELSDHEVGVASDLGAAVWTDDCRCSSGRPRCLACLTPVRVADVAERLAGLRWPWDRLAQLGIRRPRFAKSRPPC